MKSILKAFFRFGALLSICCFLSPITLLAQWQLVDSTSFQVRLAADSNCFITFNPGDDSLEVTLPERGLSETALLALEKAPDWLKPALEDNLARLATGLQDTYAGIILNSTDPFVDELCFEIAHLAPRTLRDMEILDVLEVLTENVSSLYRIDSLLDYAEIVDYGNSSQGGDYYSTVSYSVEQDGDTLDFELPREIYYWYLAHPKLHKETPAYIDPNTGNPSWPPYGFFWRDYLMNHADGGYPVLKDMLEGVETLWNNVPDTIENGAIGVLTAWVDSVMDFISHAHHDQPVRIYHLHKGTCSVHSYLTSAAARAALIPATVTVMYCDDHKVNEFWERRWISWEPVGIHIDNPRCYDPGWGWDIAAVFDWRGDGFIWDVTERYTEVCTLKVTVSDAGGNPVDGARIKLSSEGSVAWGATAGWTIETGEKQFLLGDSRNFTGRVDSELGGYPPSGMEQIITGSQPGAVYTWEVTLPGDMPQLEILPDTLPENPRDEFKIELEFELPSEILYGDNLDDNDSFSEFVSPGQIDLFICDQANFDDYIAGSEFKAFEIQRGVPQGEVEFVFPTDDIWHLVFSNEKSTVLTQQLEVVAYLYQKSTGVAEREESEIPRSFKLVGNYPNPFNSQTTISYQLPMNSEVKLEVYNLLGQKITTLVDERQEAGYKSVIWEATAVSSGIYFCKLTTEEFVQTKRMLLIQ